MHICVHTAFQHLCIYIYIIYFEPRGSSGRACLQACPKNEYLQANRRRNATFSMPFHKRHSMHVKKGILWKKTFSIVNHQPAFYLSVRRYNLMLVCVRQHPTLAKQHKISLRDHHCSFHPTLVYKKTGHSRLG